jgi:hypothetical protein
MATKTQRFRQLIAAVEARRDPGFYSIDAHD